MTSTPESTRAARISIIGAGPGGLTCARILQQHGIPVMVYDGDTDRHARNQGGSLDLHADNGQIALREAGLLEAFFEHSRPEGQQMREYDVNGALLLDQVPDVDERFKPEIDRGVLRDLLLDSLEPGTVCWGRRLESVDGPVDGPPEGPRTLRFADGTTVASDLVIGADGAWSRVRRSLSSAVPDYVGVTFLEAWFDEVDTRHPEIAELVGHGGAHSGDGTRGLFAQRNGGDHIRVYIIQQRPADWIAQEGLRADDTGGIREHLLREFAAWSPQLQRLVSENDGAYVDRPIFALPVPHTWDRSATATLLGDAAHLMPPLGVGVNMAMLDASELALAIAKSTTAAEAVRLYEESMLPRSVEYATMLQGHAADLLGAMVPEFD